MVLKYDDKYVKPHSIYEAVLNANEDKIHWYVLAAYPAAIELLTANPDKIVWEIFCETPFLEYDYEQIEKERASLNQTIIAAVHHPDRVQKWLDDGNDIDDYMN